MKLSNKLKKIRSLNTRPEEFPGLNKMREEYCYASIDHIEAVDTLVMLLTYLDYYTKVEDPPESAELIEYLRKVIDNDL